MVDGRERVPRIELFALDVGQGDASLILLPDSHAPILFDCADDWVVNQFMDNWGIRHLSAVIVSHLDRDHIGGMEGFLRNFTEAGGRVAKVFLSEDRHVEEATPGAILAKSLIDYVITEAETGRWAVYPVTVSDAPIASGSGWSVRLLAPSQETRLALARSGQRAPNLLSGALRLEVGENAILVGGDAPLRTWASLPSADLRARVFRIPHHGGALTDGGVPEGWGPDRLYDSIGPDVAILSVGKGHDHPNPDWISPVAGRHGCRLLCTQVTRRCEPTMGGQPSGLRASAIRSPHFAEPPWRHLDDRDRPRRDRYEIPCAGTVLAELSGNGEVRVLPQADGPHQRLVDGWLSPLCRPART